MTESSDFYGLDDDVTCLIVVVTHNSKRFVQWCLDGLESAKSKLAIRVLDSGSTDTTYLRGLRSKHFLQMKTCSNVGFVAGNNLCIHRAHEVPWVLFLNPDARVEGAVLDSLLEIAESSVNENVAIFSVPLIRYDIGAGKPLSCYDSVGIVCTWYGKWRDRLSGVQVVDGEDVSGKAAGGTEAICGAFMLTRSAALNSALDSTGNRGFERTYYMYKEDIEICLRMKRAGWELKVLEQFFAYHCRGWSKVRMDVPYWARLQSARNDLSIAFVYKRSSIVFAFVKLVWVLFFEPNSAGRFPRTIALVGERFDAACIELASVAKEKSAYDLWLGIESGGAHVLRRMLVLGVVKSPYAFVKASRPSTKLKNSGVTRTLLRLLPEAVTKRLRALEHLTREMVFNRKRRVSPRSVVMTDQAIAHILKAKSIVLIDDAVDTGSSAVHIIEEIKKLNPTCQLKVAAIAQTFKRPLRIPDFWLYRATLVRFPWSADSPS